MCCQQFSTPLPTSALYNLWMVLYLSYFLYWCYTNSNIFLYLTSHCKYVKFLLLLYVIILFFIPKFLSNISGIKSNHFESKSCSTLHEIVAKDLLLTHVTALAFFKFSYCWNKNWNLQFGSVMIYIFYLFMFLNIWK